MEFIQNKDDNSKNIVNRKEKFFYSLRNENFDYLYPHGHRKTIQIRWFKNSLRKDLKPFIAV